MTEIERIEQRIRELNEYLQVIRGVDPSEEWDVQQELEKLRSQLHRARKRAKDAESFRLVG